MTFWRALRRRPPETVESLEARLLPPSPVDDEVRRSADRARRNQHALLRVMDTVIRDGLPPPRRAEAERK